MVMAQEPTLPSTAVYATSETNTEFFIVKVSLRLTFPIKPIYQPFPCVTCIYTFSIVTDCELGLSKPAQSTPVAPLVITFVNAISLRVPPLNCANKPVFVLKLEIVCPVPSIVPMNFADDVHMPPLSVYSDISMSATILYMPPVAVSKSFISSTLAITPSQISASKV